MENVIFSRFDWTTCVFIAVNVKLNIIHYPFSMGLNYM